MSKYLNKILVLILVFNSFVAQAAIEFDGVDDYVSAPQNSIYDFGASSDFSISYWVKVNSYAGYDAHVGKVNVANGYVASGFYTGSNYQLRFWLNNTVNVFYTSSLDYLSDWHQIVMLRQGTLGKIFEDGTLVANGAVSSSSLANIGDLRIGNDVFSSDLAGKIDDVRIYNRALSATEVAVIAQSKRKRLGGNLVNGLVAHYEMDDKEIGSIVNMVEDKSSNANHGTYTNFANLANSLKTEVPTNLARGTSLQFDGVNDYVLVDKPASLTDQMSLCLWAKWTSVGTTIGSIQILVDNNHSSAPNRGFVLQDRPDLSKHLTFTTSPLMFSGAESTFIVGDGNFHFICGTNNGTVTKLFIDGNLNASAAETPNNNYQSLISFGHWQAGTRYLNGLLDDVRIYNRALTDSEVSFLFNGSGANPGLANLVGYWDLDDSPVKDSSGNNNHGTGLGGSSIKFTESIVNK
jgi:hypothetical protein